MKKILALSNDLQLLQKISDRMGFLGFEVWISSRPENIFNELDRLQPDLLIIDFILNDHNGGAICHQVKCNTDMRDLPVILLSEYNGLERFSNKFGCTQIVNRSSGIQSLTHAVCAILGAKVPHFYQQDVAHSPGGYVRLAR